MPESIFPNTHWSGVLDAAAADPVKARRAFEELCANYRDAIVLWMCLQGLPRQDAEDAAHDFLNQWLQRENPLQGFQRGERRFREFLSVCLRRFLIDWLARRRAIRRGGGFEHVTWEHDDVIGVDGDPSLQIDYAFATQIRDRTTASLKLVWQSKLSGERFDRLQAIALGEVSNPGYAEAAQEFGVPVNTVKSWVFRFRREYHDAFRDAVNVLADPTTVDHDVIHLHQLLLNPPSNTLNKTSDSCNRTAPLSVNQNERTIS